VAVLVSAALVIVTFRDRLLPGTETDVEPELPLEAEAPPDLRKFRDAYVAGTSALARNDNAEAIRQLSSFTFGSRAVEDYRLYYLASAYEKAGNARAARLTLARLWRRNPRLVHASAANNKLGTLYNQAGDWERAAEVFAATPHQWSTVAARINSGDIASALFAARSIVIHAPASKEADDAIAFVRAMTGLNENEPLDLTPSERLERATASIDKLRRKFGPRTLVPASLLATSRTR